MTAVPIPDEARRAHGRAPPVQVYARITGALLLASLVAGGFGEWFAPATLVVSADAAATASNVVAHGTLFRLGFAGYLIYRSGYLPRFLGVLFALGGLGFVLQNFVLVLAPAWASSLLLLPTVLAAAAMTFWMLVKGVDVERWEEKAALAAADVS